MMGGHRGLVPRSSIAAVRVAVTVVGCLLGFQLCQGWYRRFETRISVDLLQFLARSPHRPTVYKGTSILVLPYHGIAFRALITPSCSAAASLLALAFLSSLSPRYGPGRRFVATAAALLMVAVGNIARISLSVLAGLFSGVSSLVLFHDWVGGIMTFVYTLGGYITMLMILLPGDDDDAAASSEADVGVGEGAVVGVT